MDAKLPRNAFITGAFGNPRARLVEHAHRFDKRGVLFGFWKHLYLKNGFHRDNTRHYVVKGKAVAANAEIRFPHAA